jgi:hypothetical protein
MAAVIARLPPRWRRSPRAANARAYRVVSAGASQSGETEHHLFIDGRRVARALDLDRLCDHLEADLQLHVAEMAPHRVFVHAGVVGWGGSAIVVPGASGSGKTTLVAALVRLGATYYSDEYAVLDGRGRVHPYPSPLSVRESHDRPTKYAVEALGGRRGRRPLPVGLVVVGAYEPGAAFAPHRLSPGRAVLALLAHTVSARRQPVLALRALSGVATRATVLEGARGHAGATAATILDPGIHSSRV